MTLPDEYRLPEYREDYREPEEPDAPECCADPDWTWRYRGTAKDGTVFYRGTCHNCGATREEE